MNRFTQFISVQILLLFVICRISAQAVDFPFQNPKLSIDQRVNDLVSRLTLEEKIGQLMYNAPAVERLGVPAYNWWNECLHGVARNGRATVFPQAIGLGATFDTDLIHRIAGAIATEGRAKYNVSSAHGYRERYQGLTFWTPNINIFRDPRWGRGQETYGEDPFLTSQIGLAFVKGLQGDNPNYLKAAALAKHYAVHSGPEALRHEFDAKVSMKDLWETYLPAFEVLVKEGKVEGVMGAYNRTNGDPCCAHPYLMGEVLRKKWGFKGYYVSDCWALRDFFEGHKVVKTAPEAAALALNLGCNLNCGNVYPTLHDAIKQGLTSEKEVDKNLKELLPSRFKLGLFDPVGAGPFDHIGPEVVRSPAHIALSREAAMKSMVLLKNKDNVLPIKKEVSRLFVCGPVAADAQALLANYYGISDDLRTILEGIVGKVSPQTTIEYRQGALLDETNRNPQDWFSSVAADAEVTIACLGITQLIEGEEGESIASRHLGDRVDIGLPQNQIDFLKNIRSKAKKLVVVMTGGSAIACPEVYDMADALLFVWYPGEQGGLAAADLLFGDAVPSGRLAVTVPKSVNDLPPYEDYAMAGRTYRYMEKEPLFPFGFGLSYATFQYGSVKLDKSSIKRDNAVDLEIQVTNTGKYKADEVVQLYLTDMEASVPVPQYALKSFQRITLEPGASQKVRFRITPEMMQMVDEKGERRIEPGKFKVQVGGSVPSKRSLDLGAAQWQEAIFEVK